MSVLASSVRTPLGRLTDRRRIAIGRALIVFALLVAVIAFGLLVVLDALALDVGLWARVVLGLWAYLLFWFLIGGQPRNRVVWLFVWLGVLASLLVLSDALVSQATTSRGLPDDPSGIPLDDLGLIGAIAIFFGEVSGFVLIVAMPTLALAWFPDGRSLSRRWSIIPALVGSGLLMDAFVGGWETWPFRAGGVASLDVEDPGYYGTPFLDGIEELGALLILIAVVLSVASLMVRYRRSGASVQRQLRWILWGSATAASVVVTTSVIGGPQLPELGYGLMFLLMFSCYTVAIWRHHLFDIDVIISRTLVYVSVLAVITVVYVTIVFGVGTLIGQSSDSPVLPIVATAVIAMVFHPVRMRLERLANRIVFGRRATPYEVLSEFTQRVAATDDELLVDVARLLADGTIATSATVWTVHDNRLEPVSVWPDRQGVMATTLVRAEDSGRVLVPGADETYPIEQNGEPIGALGLSMPTGESLPPADRALIGELTAGIGLALWNRQLTKELQRNVDDLRASRRRLVAIQDDTRHSLERDLHDGAQQRLVAVKVRLSIAQQMAAKAGADGRADRLAALCAEADEAIESLRDFARGVYPPLLEAEGLRVALDAHATRSRLPIEVRGAVEQRQQREIEATVYFCVVETLALIERSGTAHAVEITLTDQQGRLAFDVRADHGGTWESELPERVLDRIEAVDGVLAYETSAGTTTVTGSVPVPAIGHHPAVRDVTGELIDR